ncbi:C6 zinc finger protein [Colletotrichum salicis]|uniref:C6 zinc finger protein n=1 Tax=Colletotrichum salicis TaxID=1209931 RepID=A0A135S9Y6_9PEZI|nr:C6 zinc finger protein [Colletotrichum salicis]
MEIISVLTLKLPLVLSNLRYHSHSPFHIAFSKQPTEWNFFGYEDLAIRDNLSLGKEPVGLGTIEDDLWDDIGLLAVTYDQHAQLWDLQASINSSERDSGLRDTFNSAIIELKKSYMMFCLQPELRDINDLFAWVAIISVGRLSATTTQ